MLAERIAGAMLGGRLQLASQVVVQNQFGLGHGIVLVERFIDDRSRSTCRRRTPKRASSGVPGAGGSARNSRTSSRAVSLSMRSVIGELPSQVSL
jgi:hypothetical protein